MSKRRYKIPLLIVGISILFAAGCSSIQTQGTRQIDAILSDGTLDVKRTDTPQLVAEKKEIRQAMQTARTEIIQAEKDKIAAENKTAKAEAKAEKNAEWARRGKIAILYAIGAGLVVLLVVIGRIVSWVTGLRRG